MANGLQALLAKKKAESNAAQVSSVPADDTPSHEGLRDGASESPSVPRKESTGASTSQRPANPFGKRKDSGPSDSSGGPADQPSASGGTASSGNESRPKLAGISVSAKPQHSGSASGSVAPRSLDSLDALNESTDAGIAPREGVTQYFSDETPAQKPTRELPEGLTKEQLGFVDMIDGVFEVMHEPDLLGGVIRNIIIELKSNPEYMRLVAPDDIRAWVRGMRESMGLAKIKKTESKARKAGGSGKKSKLVDDDMLSDLADLGVEIPT